MSQFVLSDHALQEIARRGLPQDIVMAVLNAPEQIVSGSGQRSIYQSRLSFGSQKLYLVRVVVDETVSPTVVITAYRTSQLKKYWRNP